MLMLIQNFDNYHKIELAIKNQLKILWKNTSILFRINEFLFTSHIQFSRSDEIKNLGYTYLVNYLNKTLDVSFASFFVWYFIDFGWYSSETGVATEITKVSNRYIYVAFKLALKMWRITLWNVEQYYCSFKKNNL